MSVGIANTPFARSDEKLLRLINDLHSSGAHTEIDPPRVVVIGNQSSGKSSLVEAVSAIKLPRSAGTCTRCPMECRLIRKNLLWQCQIYLRREVDRGGHRLAKPAETPFGPLIRDKDQLESMIRKAQLAILNPSIESQRFVDATPEEVKSGPFATTREISFSPDVVCLDIQAPDVPNLSFIDLPGIISNVEDEKDKQCIDMIRDLVRTYIKGNALILLTITMKEDIDLQSAALLASEADPTGVRTLGVLTKADTVQEGEEQQWKEILEGRKYQLKHGYFITKQPSQQELMSNISHQAGRENETRFFSSSALWNDVPASVKNRMGVEKLTAQLSALLIKLIQKTLPVLRADAREALTKVQSELCALPKPPSDNPRADLLRLTRNFTSHVDRYLEGSEDCENLMHSCRTAYLGFKSDLSMTVPLFYPRALVSGATVPDMPDAQFLRFDQADDHVPSDPVPDQLSLNLCQMRKELQHSRTRELPRNIPFRVKTRLFHLSSKQWGSYAHECFKFIHERTQEKLLELVKEYFGDYTNTPLRDQVVAIVDKQLFESHKIAEEHLELVMSLEKRCFTMNEDQFNATVERYLTQYKASIPKLTTSFLEEMNVMAEVQAYFRIAYKRVIDNVPRAIDQGFLMSLSENLETALHSGLGLDGPDSGRKAAEYLAEDADVSANRADLTARRERLEEIVGKLFDFN